MSSPWILFFFGRTWQWAFLMLCKTALGALSTSKSTPVHRAVIVRESVAALLQAHELNQVLGLAMEANFQAGRKYFYELLSPWQAGILTVACWPAIPNVDLVLGALAGYGANPCPSIGFPAKLALAYYHSMPSSPSGLDSSTQITTS